MRRPAEIFARSLLAERALPARRELCSGKLGWQTILARIYRDPAGRTVHHRAVS